MNEFANVIKILQDLGIIQIFSIPIGFLLFLYIVKKVLSNGTGRFLQRFFETWITSEQEKLKNNALIDVRLVELCEKYEVISRIALDNRENINQRVGALTTLINAHIDEMKDLQARLLEGRNIK